MKSKVNPIKDQLFREYGKALYRALARGEINILELNNFEYRAVQFYRQIEVEGSDRKHVPNYEEKIEDLIENEKTELIAAVKEVKEKSNHEPDCQCTWCVDI